MLNEVKADIEVSEHECGQEWASLRSGESMKESNEK
jgi:hypothetical protein